MSLQKKLLERQTDKKRSVHNRHWIRIDEMQEAVRDCTKEIPAILNELNGTLREITMGDFDDRIQDAMDEAEKKMFVLLVGSSPTEESKE